MRVLKRTDRAAAALATVLALVAVACGDDDNAAVSSDETTQAAVDSTAPDDSSVSTSGEDATGQATGTVIKIGLLYSETGRSASTFSTANDVAAAWADHVNTTKQGIGGHVVEILAYDVESDAAVATEKVREAVEQDGVSAVMVFDGNAETAVRSYLSDKNIPMIGSVSSSYVTDQPATEFPMSTSGKGSWLSTLAATAAAGSHLGYIVCSEVPACSEPDDFFQTNAERFGVTYTPNVLASHQEASYTAACLAATSDEEDVLGLAFAAEVVPIIFDECQLQGYGGYLLGTGGTVSGAVYDTFDGVKVVGWLEGFPWWADDPAAKEFRDVVAAASPDLDYRLTAATLTWAELEFFAKVMGERGPAADTEVTAADIISVYFSVEGENVNGLLPGPLTFSDAGTQPPVTCAFLFTYENGEFRTLAEGASGNGAVGDLQSTCSDL